METKIIKKRFTLADFNDMQEFLQEQHSGQKYIFEKYEPDDFICDGKKMKRNT